MDPYYEQRLRDEVSYLHSLWHQGPPRNPNLQRNPTHNPSRPLQVSNPTQFKKEKTRARRKRVKKSKKRPPESDPPRVSDVEWTGKKPAEGPTLKPPSAPKTTLHSAAEQAQFPTTQLCDLTQLKKEKTRARRRGKKGKKRQPESDPPPVSGVEWPGEKPSETPSSSASGWSIVKPPSARLPSAEEQARFAATKVQHKALKAVQEFFVVSDGREDGGSDEDDFMDEDKYEEYKFFMNIFTEDGELRGYYEKNCEGGDFCCLVCGGTGKKVGKRFKECVALVHHSLQIAKTKKKRAHRAYAQVICKVLGWDIDRLPTIVLSLGDPLGRSLAKSGESQEVSNAGQEEDLHDFSVPGTSNVVGHNVMLCESSLKVCDANKTIENLDSRVLSMADGKTEGGINCLGNAEVGMEDLDMLNQSSGSENVKNRKLILKEVPDVGREDELHNSSVPGTSNVADNVMLCENSTKVGDANKGMEKLEQGVLSMVDGKTEGAVNCPEPCKDNGIGHDMNNNEKGIVAVNDLKDNNRNQN